MKIGFSLSVDGKVLSTESNWLMPTVEFDVY